jgi:ribosomal protein S18 acetylase RimI-like enzyme
LQDTPLKQFAALSSEALAEATVSIFEADELRPGRRFDGEAFERRYQFEHLDRCASRVQYAGPEPIGMVVIARRGWTCHVSGLGVSPRHRQKGIATSLLALSIRDARDRGDRRVIAEVRSDNTAAIRMYQRCGFARGRTLTGFVGEQRPAAAVDRLVEVDSVTVAERIMSNGGLELPWFYSPAALMGVALPTRSYALDGQAYVTVTAHGTELNLRALFVEPDRRRQGLGRRLIAAVCALHSSNVVRVLPLVPVGLADEFFEALGFSRLSPALYELELRL